MLEFSIPLMFQEEYIDKIEKLNKSLKKSQVTSVYSCFPRNLPNKCGYEQIRVDAAVGINNQEDFFNQVKKAQDSGLEFIYLLNSPRSLDCIDFYERSPQINYFAELLLSNNIRILRITNTQLIDYISCNYPEFEIRTSTSQEYSSIRQYNALFKSFPNISEVVPSWEMNRNLKFLKTFKNTFSQNLEIMVNEGCLPGCPFRTHHNSSLLFDRRVPDEYFAQIPPRFKTLFVDLCTTQYFKNAWESMMLTNIVYPWDIDTYVEKCNITKFKLVGRNSARTKDSYNNYFDFYTLYMKGIEDFDILKEVPYKWFNHYVCEVNHPVLNEIKVKDIIDYLPKVEYFEKNGYNCANVCGSECRYCYNIAEKLTEKYPINILT